VVPYKNHLILGDSCSCTESFCQDLQAEHINMRVKLIVLIVLLPWRWDLPIVLYPGAPPQYRSGVSQLPTSQPLKQGYIVTVFNVFS
jgi:hypothetical protein